MSLSLSLNYIIAPPDHGKIDMDNDNASKQMKQENSIIQTEEIKKQEEKNSTTQV